VLPVQQQLNNEPLFGLAEQRLDRPHDPGLAADLDAIADLERFELFEMTSRNDRVSPPEFVSVPSHHRYNGSRRRRDC
jgi:hypothetical protein